MLPASHLHWPVALALSLGQPRACTCSCARACLCASTAAAACLSGLSVAGAQVRRMRGAGGAVASLGALWGCSACDFLLRHLHWHLLLWWACLQVGRAWQGSPGPTDPLPVGLCVAEA